MRKAIIILLSLGAVLLLGAVIYFAFFFELFPVERVNKKRLELKNCKVYVDYLPGNATAQSVLQIRTVYGSDETVLENKEFFSSVESMRMLNDSLLEIVITDSSFSSARETDTLLMPQCCR